MNLDNLSLSNRLVKSHNFIWTPGMLAIRSNGTEFRVAQVVYGDEDYPAGRISNGWGDWGSFDGATPDLSDPATVGCLLFLAKEVTNQPRLFIESREDRHYICAPSSHGTLIYNGNCSWSNLGFGSPLALDTLEEALVVAIEYAEPF
jgi:hypothetical protein